MCGKVTFLPCGPTQTKRKEFKKSGAVKLQSSHRRSTYPPPMSRSHTLSVSALHLPPIRTSRAGAVGKSNFFPPSGLLFLSPSWRFFGVSTRENKASSQFPHLSANSPLYYHSQTTIPHYQPVRSTTSTNQTRRFIFYFFLI